MEYYEKLDAVLGAYYHLLKNNPDEKMIEFVRNEPDYNTFFIGDDDESDDLVSLKQKLGRDDHLMMFYLNEAEYYHEITPKGIKFFEAGGYTNSPEEVRKRKRKEMSQRMTKFLYELAEDDDQFLVIEEDKYGINDIVPKLIKLGLIEVVKARYRLTEAGIILTDSEGTVDDFIKSRSLFGATPINYNVQGHMITGGEFKQSSLDIKTDNSVNKKENKILGSTFNNSPVTNDFSNNKKTTTTNNITPENSKKPYYERVEIWISLILGLSGLYGIVKALL